MIDQFVQRSGVLLFASLAAVGCSGGGGGGSAGTTSFQVSGLSLTNGSVWQINREIVFTFSEPVDFSTVSSNTINIRSIDDVPATGIFRMTNANTVVFQPTCPTLEDYSDAGLEPGGVSYVLRIAGLNTSQNTVRSMAGVPLGIQQTRAFSTPASTQSSVAFQDTRPGPPAPIVRETGSAEANATYMEISEDPDNRVYFEVDGNGDHTLSVPGFQVPLNLYSDTASSVAVLIAFNQPVNPSTSNISQNRLRLEYQDAGGVWHPLATRVELQANCTETGALVRLEPIGVLPAASSFRAVVKAGFQDIVGETNLQSSSEFATAPTRAVDFSSLTPSDQLSDEINESFVFGGDDPLSFEDQTALFDTPPAEWGGGQLSAAFSFDGTGGPNGNFDWVVRTGELFFFDTTNTPIVGGPDGVPTTTLNAVNGVVDVRNLIIEEGGEIRVQGPNPMRINATGDVIIRGRFDLSGFSAKDVATLNTGNQVEIGGAGVAGGGRGGNANDNITGPTPRGGRGQGPFRQANLGGEGGELGWSTSAGKNNRRPGGGGGGRFARDWAAVQGDETTATTVTHATGVDVIATAGNDGHTTSIGSESGTSPAAGGRPGQGPFLDTSNENDFFGVRPVIEGGNLIGLIRGELPSLWAGYGGGGGGNAGKIFPNPSWNLNSDEKGGGGGGASGGLHVKALGSIVFGATGQILANGGRGATGENTNFLDHIGGTGGAGSGGHVILESATAVDFTDGGAAADQPVRDVVLVGGPIKKSGPGSDVDPCCKKFSNGGAGGSGVVQIHIPNTTLPPGMIGDNTDIFLPTAALAEGDPIDQVTSPPAYIMIPTFGARSKVRSKWISIGGADQKPSGMEGLVRFLFDGIKLAAFDNDPEEGKVLSTGATVNSLTPLVVDDDLSSSTTSVILSDGFTMQLRGAALDSIRGGATAGVSNDVYLRTPALLHDCAIRMRVVSTPSNFEDFTIASAEYDEGTAAAGDETLNLTVTTDRGRLDRFNGGAAGTGYQLIPRFFQVVTNGLADSLPSTAFVRVLFQATGDNGIGNPDEQGLLVDWTADISKFNALSAGSLQFFRYEVEFNLDSMGQGVSGDTEAVTLDFLKIPFVF